MRDVAHSAAPPDQAPYAVAEAVFADAKAYLSSREAQQMSESELAEAAPTGPGVDAQAPARTPRSTQPGEGCRSGRGGRRCRALAAARARTPPGDDLRHGAGCAPRWVARVDGAQTQLDLASAAVYGVDCHVVVINIIHAAEADLDAIFCIRQLNPNPRHASSLPELVALLRPVWVIIDTWQHYLKAHRVTDTAGPGEQGLLLGDVVDLAREYDAAITVSHHNMKNRNEYRDSTALGAVADMIVSLSRGETPTARRLEPSGRWRLDPVDIRWTRGVGYEVVKDADADASSAWSPAVPIDERVLLHLLELGPEARPPARVLAGALQCQGRRYEELSAALERLVADGSVDHAQRPGTTRRRDRGYALTPKGRLRTESLRENSDSEVSTNREEADAGPKGATVSEVPSPGANGNGNAPATPVEVKEKESGDAEAGDVDGQEGLS